MSLAFGILALTVLVISVAAAIWPGISVRLSDAVVAAMPAIPLLWIAWMLSGFRPKARSASADATPVAQAMSMEHDAGAAPPAAPPWQSLSRMLETTSQAQQQQMQSLRAELSILRDELEARREEVKALRLGHEHHARHAVLLRVLRALAILDEDERASRPAAGTLMGVRIELEECLEDNHVEIVDVAPGTPLADVAGFDPRHAVAVPAEAAEQVGTVAAVERPAYIARGPLGERQVMLPPRVRVYRAPLAAPSTTNENQEAAP